MMYFVIKEKDVPAFVDYTPNEEGHYIDLVINKAQIELVKATYSFGFTIKGQYAGQETKYTFSIVVDYEELPPEKEVEVVEAVEEEEVEEEDTGDVGDYEVMI